MSLHIERSHLAPHTQNKKMTYTKANHNEISEYQRFIKSNLKVFIYVNDE